MLIHGDPKPDSGATESLVEAAGSALVGVVGPDLTDEPSAALGRTEEAGSGFRVVDPDRTPARALNSEDPEIVVRLDLGDADPPPARLTTELAVRGAAISVLKQPDADPSLSMTDLALLRQFRASSRRPSISWHTPAFSRMTCSCCMTTEWSASPWRPAQWRLMSTPCGAIAPGSPRRQSDDLVPFLPKMDSAEAEAEDED